MELVEFLPKKQLHKGSKLLHLEIQDIQKQLGINLAKYSHFLSFVIFCYRRSSDVEFSPLMTLQFGWV